MDKLRKRHPQAHAHTDPDPDDTRLEFFKVFIPEHASHQLLIPPSFQKHLKENPPQKTTITGPHNRKWSVNLKREGKDYFFKEGWQDFVKDHAIELGDFLVFRYDASSSFSVKLFGRNGCLKKISTAGETARVKEESMDFEFVEKRKMRRKRKEARQSSEGLEHTKEAAQVQQTIHKNKGGRPPKIWKQSFQRLQHGIEAAQMQETTLGREAGRPLWEDSPNLEGGEAASAQQTLNTENEDDAALDVDSRSISEHPSFRTVLRNVRNGYLSIPFGFVNTFIPGESRDLYLQVSNRLWPVRLCMYPNFYCRFSRGWSKFVRENYLQDGDVCDFELIEPPCLTFKVSILKCL
ncbi:hypothetical protein Ancab_026049 [Ancistrocladus abbreviatus]